MSHCPVVITGFMGAGKTTVGRALANLLGETFIEGAEECVAVSFPEFFPLLDALAAR